MAKDGDNYKLEGVVIRGTGYNYSTKNDDPSPAYIEVKDIVNNPEYKDTVTLVFDPSAKTLTAENIKADAKMIEVFLVFIIFHSSH
jgi:hypothetical protein